MQLYSRTRADHPRGLRHISSQCCDLVMTAARTADGSDMPRRMFWIGNDLATRPSIRRGGIVRRPPGSSAAPGTSGVCCGELTSLRGQPSGPGQAPLRFWTDRRAESRTPSGDRPCDCSTGGTCHRQGPAGHRTPPTPAEHHYTEAKQGLAQLARLGLDEPERLVETLVAICHAVLSIAATFARPRTGRLTIYPLRKGGAAPFYPRFVP